ncbi:glycosyl hydrolase family 18 protein [Microlunatus sp. GCM10028923]|uniref:glycosyl hydrolase family 18 protein n=1 Tax=Microlunatus sp. GCM10028923 TaxID=3273400 RepID=UPI0036154F35
MTGRLMVYHQSHGTGADFVELQPMIASGRLTQLIIAAVHITDDGRIVLNDHDHDDPYHDQLWSEVSRVRAAGVPVLAMVGGWAPGTTDKLDGAGLARYYPPLRDFLARYAFDGIDIDVEQDMSLAGVIALIDALRADFGPDFAIILAPVASALAGGGNLSGFDYEELYRERGHEIAWVNAQFYSGFGSAADPADYVTIIERGVYPPDKVVLGMIGNPADGHGYVDVDRVAETVRDLVQRYPEFGGVDVWEYFRALPGGRSEPWRWIDLMADAMTPGPRATSDHQA